MSSEFPVEDGLEQLRSFRFPDQYDPMEVLSVTEHALVVQAYDVMRDLEVVIKILTDVHPDAEQRFAHEVQTTKRNNHPHLMKALDEVRVEDCDENRFRPAMVLPYVSETLWGIAPDIRDSFVKDEVEELLVGSAAGLHAFHQQDPRWNVHRDVKPENFVVTEEGVAQLIDFGQARVRKNIALVLQEERCLGTARYMPPEQWTMTGADLSAETDWFAFAASWYAILTGEDLFPNCETVEDIATQAVKCSKQPAIARIYHAKWAERLGDTGLISDPIRKRLLLMLSPLRCDRFVSNRNVPRTLQRDFIRARGEGPRGLQRLVWLMQGD